MFGIFRRTPRAQEPERFEILLDGVAVPVEYARDRHKTLRISVRREGFVRVRGPLRSTRAQAEDFLRRKGAWILRHLQRFRELEQAAPRLRYVDGEVHLFLGRRLPLELRSGARGSVALLPQPGNGGTLVVTTRGEPSPEQVERLLAAWYRAQAKDILPQVLRELLPRVRELGPANPTRLRVRGMKSRWGSCSRAGVITMNLELLKTPPECIEYVAAHELCHLLRLAHDERFYACLSAVMPDWKERRARLRDFPLA